MEKIAFISDIHSNLPALEAAIVDIKSRNINRIYCLGDIIGYHTFTNEVIKVLQDNHVISIKGNHDEAITEGNFDRSKIDDFVLYWNYDRLTKENREYLMHLPVFMEFIVDRKDIMLVHGSPDSISEYIREDSEEMIKYFELMECDLLLCAHTHLPYIKEKNGKYILNTGSIGKPKFGKPEASYLTVAFDNGKIEPEIISVKYAHTKMMDSLKENNFPNKLIKAIETGLP